MTIRWKALIPKREGADELHQHKVLREAGGILNDLLHAETNHHTHLDPCTLNIDHWLSVLNPLLTEFIALATRTVRERYHPSLATKEEMTSCHVKSASILYPMFASLLYQPQTSPANTKPAC